MGFIGIMEKKMETMIMMMTTIWMILMVVASPTAATLEKSRMTMTIILLLVSWERRNGKENGPYIMGYIWTIIGIHSQLTKGQASNSQHQV